ncbi:MAG: hypothetical protein U0269_33585 [Polyangiales bacterium]
MSDFFSKLAEARIREWQSRPEKEREAKSDGELVRPAPLEVQLFDEARTLYEKARKSADAVEAAAMREKAAGIETRIMVLLEESGRPLAAQQFAKMLAEEREKR